MLSLPLSVLIIHGERDSVIPFHFGRKLYLIGVGRASCSPSLRTVQADFPHTALQLVVLPG